MNKLTRYIFLVTITVIFFFTAFNRVYAESYIFNLNAHGAPIGKWGVEKKVENSCIVYECVSNFPNKFDRVRLLKNFYGKKSIEIKSSLKQKMVRMVFGKYKWNVSLNKNRDNLNIDKYIQKKDKWELSDNLRIYPVLPVYDLVTFIFALQNNNLSSFDFYLIENKIEKRVQAIKVNSKKWELSCEDNLLCEVTLNSKGLPENIDFSSSVINEIKKYSISLKQVQSGGLKITEKVTPDNILSCYLKKNQQVKKIKSCNGKYKKTNGETHIVFKDCFNIKKDITKTIKNYIVSKMKNIGAIKNNFIEDAIKIEYDKAKKIFYPKFNNKVKDTIYSKKLLLPEIKSKRNISGISNIKIEVLKTNNKINGLEISYSYENCSESKLYKKFYLREFIGTNDEYSGFTLKDSSTTRIVVKPNYSGVFNFLKQEFPITTRDQYIFKFLLNEYKKSPSDIFFLTSEIEQDVEQDGAFQVGFKIESCKSKTEKYIVIFPNYFANKIGINAQFISYDAKRNSNGSINVSFKLQRQNQFSLNELTLNNILSSNIKKDFPYAKFSKITIEQKKFYSNFHTTLNISQNKILNLMNFPKKTVVKLKNNVIYCTYSQIDK